MRSRFALAAGTAALAVAGSVLAAAPAHAQDVTFTLAGDVIAIAEPAAAAALTPSGSVLGLTALSATGSLGSTVVTDNRAGVLGWSSKITGTTDFTNGTTTIPVAGAKVWVPGAVTTTGVATTTAAPYLTEATGLALTSAAQSLVTATVVVGNNTATFSPSISVPIPAGATAGAYTGVVTQTVA